MNEALSGIAMTAAYGNQTQDFANAALALVEAIDPDTFALGPNTDALTGALWPTASITPLGFTGLSTMLFLAPSRRRHGAR